MKALSPLIRLAAFILLATLTGCSSREDGWKSEPLPEDAVTILTHGPDSKSKSHSAADSILRKAFPHASTLSADQLAAAGPALRRDGVVLVVPQIRELSPALWSALTNHTARGGLALFWGLDPTATQSDAACALLRPASEFYSFPAQYLRGIPAGAVSSARPIRLQSPFPHPTGNSGIASASQRWIPLAEAHTQSGYIKGWPASLWIDASQGQTLRAWGWIGWDPDIAFSRAQQSLLQTAAAKLHRRQFLIYAGLARHALSQNEPIAIAAQLATAPASRGPWRMVAELENDQRVVTRRVTETLAPDTPVSLVSTSLFLGTSSRRADKQQRMTLRVALVDAETGQSLDETRQALRLRPDAPPSRAADDERIGTRGASFILGRRPFTLIGTRLTSRAAAPHHNALDPDIFDLALLRDNLVRYRDAGINTLSIPYSNLAQTPQLLILLDELRDNQLWVLLEVPALSPWNPDWSRAKEQLTALRLNRDSRIFAVTPGLISPPREEEEIRTINAAWAQWITAQYGTPRHARTQLGETLETFSPASLWNHPEEIPTPLRLAARRFLEDFIGQHYRDCRAFLRENKWPVLFSAPGGTTLDPAAGAHQVDFVTLDSAALDPDQPDRTAFYTAYARAVSAGKPTLWVNLSSTVPYPPSSGDLRTQADQLDAAIRAAVRAQAAGIVLSRFSGGPLGPAGHDRGLIAPDGAWRPSGEAFRTRIQNWRHEQLSIPPWRGYEIDTVNAPDGLPGLWAHAQQSALESPPAEMRPAGWDRLSTATPLINLSGEPADSPEPLQFFNAQWSPLPADPTNIIARQPLQLELLNTSVSRWSPSVTGIVGSIWISATRSGTRPQTLPIRETAPGDRARITWIPSDAGSWTLRPLIYPDTPFGEPLDIEVK